MKTIIHIKDGTIQNPIKVDDGRYEMTLKKANTRSLQQNAYFHSILPEILQGFRNKGYGLEDIRNTEDVKLILKSLFLKKAIVDAETGEVMEIVRDTHTLNKEEMSDFIEDVLRWCAQKLDVVLFSPNEQTAFNL